MVTVKTCEAVPFTGGKGMSELPVKTQNKSLPLKMVSHFKECVKKTASAQPFGWQSVSLCQKCCGQQSMELPSQHPYHISKTTYLALLLWTTLTLKGLLSKAIESWQSNSALIVEYFIIDECNPGSNFHKHIG